MPTTVIYHRADYDGLFSAAVCKKFLPDAEFIGWDFGDPQIKQPEGAIYVVDLPLSCLENNGDSWPDITWIDHHKSSIDRGWGDMVAGHQIDGVAACRLCWQWFKSHPHFHDWPTLADFKDRRVHEPLALTLAGEYDVWDKSDHRADKFQYGLTAARLDFYDLVRLLEGGGDSMTEDLCREGEAAMNWQQAFASQVCEERSYLIAWEGHHFCVLASCHARNSMWFPQEAIPETATALMCWRYDGERVSFSLYHAPGHEEHNLSQIAVKYGGGGHRGACGFSMSLDDALNIIR